MPEYAHFRKQFIVKDLVVTVAGGNGGGSAGLPADDSTPVPSPGTPYVSVVFEDIAHQVESILEAIGREGAKGYEGFARAFAGDADAAPAVADVIQAAGRAVVAGAVVAAFASGGGSAGMPVPDDPHPLPSPITPIATGVRTALQPAHLPALRAQLRASVHAVEKSAAALAPRGAEVDAVAGTLKDALAALGQTKAS